MQKNPASNASAQRAFPNTRNELMLSFRFEPLYLLFLRHNVALLVIRFECDAIRVSHEVADLLLNGSVR